MFSAKFNLFKKVNFNPKKFYPKITTTLKRITIEWQEEKFETIELFHSAHTTHLFLEN